MPDDDACFSNEVAAEILGIAPQTLSLWRLHGKGPKFRKIGGRIEYTRAAISEYLAECAAVAARRMRVIDERLRSGRPNGGIPPR